MAQSQGYGCELYAGGAEGLNGTKLNQVFTYMRDSTVTFLGEPDANGIAIGSGTFVEYGEIRGILTCSHVLRAITASNKVNIAGHEYRDAIGITKNLTVRNHDIVEFPNIANSQPDLGFLRIDDEEAASLKARYSFLNGNKHSELSEKPEPDSDHSLHFLSGAFEHLTTKKSYDGSTATIILATHHTQGQVVKRQEVGDHDYLTFIPDPMEENREQLPPTFAATSGGGLWKYYLRKLPDNSVKLVEFRFTGIAFFQSGEQPNQITCHGPMSVHKTLKTKINEKWPSG